MFASHCFKPSDGSAMMAEGLTGWLYQCLIAAGWLIQ